VVGRKELLRVLLQLLELLAADPVSGGDVAGGTVGVAAHPSLGAGHAERVRAARQHRMLNIFSVARALAKCTPGVARAQHLLHRAVFSHRLKFVHRLLDG